VAYNAVLCEVDGMGGMEAGEVASTAALRAVLQRVAEQATGRIESAAGSDRAEMAAGSPEAQLAAASSLDPRSLIQEAAEAVYMAGQGRSVGATITCAVIEEGKLRLGHVGDTRAYLLRDGSLTQLTRDHSLVAAMVASGMLTKEEARGHPESNKVLRSLGGHKSLPEGYIDGLEVAYGEDTLQLRQGDQLVLCSDGVWGVLDDATLKRILEEARDCESAVQTAIQAVLEGGAPDNISLIVARCHSIPAL
jgi:protein phosphatase